uniref:Beta-defensin n=1 Tax=Sciurus vulgaris TaxID=55149 RepID=A0A8D2CKG0_SCIVU
MNVPFSPHPHQHLLFAQKMLFAFRGPAASGLTLSFLAAGNWYVRKCANKTGNCRKKCRSGEVVTVPATGMCPKRKSCCLLVSQDSPEVCGEGPKSTKAPGTGGGSGSAAYSME